MAILYLFVGDVFTLINYCAFVEVLSFATCVAALLWLRYKEPNMPRPIKVSVRISELGFLAVPCGFK